MKEQQIINAYIQVSRFILWLVIDWEDGTQQSLNIGTR